MKSVAAPLRLLLLPEDAQPKTEQALQALLTRLLQALCSGSHDWLSRDRLFIEIEPAVREAIRSRNWYSRREPRAEARRKALGRAISAHLAYRRPVVTCAFWHTDGDRLDYLENFERILVPIIRSALEAEGLSERLENVLRVVPTPHVEGWLYLNLAELRRYYELRHPGGHSDLRLIARWEQDPTELETTPRLKDCLAVGASHNLPLAETRYPLRAALDASASLRRLHEDLGRCNDLVRALESHNQPAKP